MEASHAVFQYFFELQNVDKNHLSITIYDSWIICIKCNMVEQEQIKFHCSKQRIFILEKSLQNDWQTSEENNVIIIFQISGDGLFTFSDISKDSSYRNTSCSDVKGRAQTISVPSRLHI